MKAISFIRVIATSYSKLENKEAFGETGALKKAFVISKNMGTLRTTEQAKVKFSVQEIKFI